MGPSPQTCQDQIKRIIATTLRNNPGAPSDGRPVSEENLEPRAPTSQKRGTLFREGMTLTFGFIGNRPDVGHWIAKSQKESLSLSAEPGGAVAFGIGFFQADEVLLRRRPADPRATVDLSAELGDIRGHALLSQLRNVHHGELTTESTPPLRFGHLLFACDGEFPDAVALRPLAQARLPAFLRPLLGQGTFPELVLGLFLAKIPQPHLERSRDVSAARGTLGAAQIRNGIRAALGELTRIADEAKVSPFVGDIWICSGEELVIGHRSGPLYLRVFRSRRELMNLGEVPPSSAAPGSDLTQAFGVVGGQFPAGEGWERLPDQTMLTLTRSAAPEVEALGC